MISLNLISLKPLGNNSSKFSRSEWNAYIDWYFVVIQSSQESKIASLQNKILRLTDAKKGLKKVRRDSRAMASSLAPSALIPPPGPSVSVYLHSLCQALPPSRGCVPSSSAPSMPPTPIYPQFPHTNFPTKLPCFSETCLTPFSAELVRIYSFKIKLSERSE